MLTGKEYHKTLPAKRMGAGAILRDQAGRVLLVEPTYKKLWEVPGGVVEALESPLSAVIRELEEELGIRFCASEFSLLSVDYLYETDVQTDALMFLFHGPTFDEQRIRSIQLENAELSSFAFVSLDDAHTKLGPVVGPRILRACEGLRTGQAIYWEDRRVG